MTNMGAVRYTPGGGGLLLVGVRMQRSVTVVQDVLLGLLSARPGLRLIWSWALVLDRIRTGVGVGAFRQASLATLEPPAVGCGLVGRTNRQPVQYTTD
jgi:hypothetical protein